MSKTPAAHHEITVFDNFTPELRDEILQKLRSRIEDPGYRQLTPQQFRSLQKLASSEHPIVSLYLQLDPLRRIQGGWRAALKDLTRTALANMQGKTERVRLNAEIDRINATLEAQLPALGRGVAFFASEPLGLWTQLSLPIELPDLITVDSRPCLRPLLRTADEHERFVLVLLSAELSRFFISQIGQAEEVLSLTGPKLRGILTDLVWKDRKDVIVTRERQDIARLLARITELACKNFEARHFLVSGPPDLRAAFADALTPELQRIIGGEFTVDVHAGVGAVSEAALPVQREIEAREEEETLRDMIARTPGHVVWGMAEVLEVLRQRRVMTLAVDDHESVPGGVCETCGTLWEAADQPCGLCGGPVRPVNDLVERALEMGLEQEARLELVRSGQGRALMRGRAPIAARLR